MGTGGGSRYSADRVLRTGREKKVTIITPSIISCAALAIIIIMHHPCQLQWNGLGERRRSQQSDLTVT